jgi:hypothetical protein
MEIYKKNENKNVTTDNQKDNISKEFSIQNQIKNNKLPKKIIKMKNQITKKKLIR